MIWNPAVRVRILSGGQYTISLRSLHSAQRLPEPSSLWGSTSVPEQLYKKAVTGACKLIDGCSLALCSATVSVVSAATTTTTTTSRWPDKSAQDKTAPTKARRQMRAVTKAHRTITHRTIASGNKSAHDKCASIVYIIKDKNWKHRMISQSSNLVVYTRKLMQITRHITRDFI